MTLGVYCFNWTQSSRSLSGSYNEGAVVLPLERLSSLAFIVAKFSVWCDRLHSH